MSTENNETDPKVEVNTTLPGEMLRQRRLELGLSQKDIAEKLRLKVSVIESIETNQFDNHHVATFIRGYFRSYAKMVGIKEKDILIALEQSGRGQHKEQPMHSFSKETERKQHDNRIMNLTWGILVIILGISSVWWWQNHQQDTLSPSSLSSEHDATNSTVNDEFQSIEATASSAETATIESASTSSMTTDSNDQAATAVDLESAVSDATPSLASNQSDQENEVASTTNADSSNVTSLSTTANEASSTESEAIAQMTQQQTNNNELSMQFKDDCWIQVKDSSGKVLSIGLKKAGQSLTLSGQMPYSIILGAPEGVSITLADEPVDLSRYTAGKVARLTLP